MKSFDELELSASIKQAITELGYTTPSPIQAEALPHLLGESTDFIGLAATGTGKTAAFGIPLLEKIDVSKRVVQGLILCPTRELALQVSGQINLLGKHKGIKALAIYGGAGYGEQIHGLKAKPAIVVGTPGRMIDHINKGTLNLQSVHTVILDEADEMISMGFKEDLETILKSTVRETSNIWLFSATMDRGVRKVADSYLRSPKQVQVNRQEMLSSTVEQIYYMTREGNKREVLGKIIDSAEAFYGIVFCQTKAVVQDLCDFLSGQGYKVDSLHGDKDQHQRERTLSAFRNRSVSILVCTDVASRGLDVKDITHVINYSIPRELDSYVHRIGRTARSGKTGFAMSLVTQSHRHLIPQIERMTKSKLVEGKLPTRKDIGTKKVGEILGKFQSQKNYSHAIELMNEEWKKEIETMSKEAIAGKFLMLAFPKLFEAEPKQDAYNAPTSTRGSYRDRDEGPRRSSNWGDKKPGGFGGGGRSRFGGSGPRSGKPGFGAGARGGKPGFGGENRPRYGGDRPAGFGRGESRSGFTDRPAAAVAASPGGGDRFPSRSGGGRGAPRADRPGFARSESSPFDKYDKRKKKS